MPPVFPLFFTQCPDLTPIPTLALFVVLELGKSVLPQTKPEVSATTFSQKHEMANCYYLGGQGMECFLETGGLGENGISSA